VFTKSVRNASELSVNAWRLVSVRESARERGAHERLPADGLDEAVHDLRDELGADARAADAARVARHALLPRGALRGHRGDGAGRACVRAVVRGARGDLLRDVCGGIS
jgi:hypothetical protein